MIQSCGITEVWWLQFVLSTGSSIETGAVSAKVSYEAQSHSCTNLADVWLSGHTLRTSSENTIFTTYVPNLEFLDIFSK